MTDTLLLQAELQQLASHISILEDNDADLPHRARPLWEENLQTTQEVFKALQQKIAAICEREAKSQTTAGLHLQEEGFKKVINAIKAYLGIKNKQDIINFINNSGIVRDFILAYYFTTKATKLQRGWLLTATAPSLSTNTDFQSASYLACNFYFLAPTDIEYINLPIGHEILETLCEEGDIGWAKAPETNKELFMDFFKGSRGASYKMLFQSKKKLQLELNLDSYENKFSILQKIYEHSTNTLSS